MGQINMNGRKSREQRRKGKKAKLKLKATSKNLKPRTVPTSLYQFIDTSISLLRQYKAAEEDKTVKGFYEEAGKHLANLKGVLISRDPIPMASDLERFEKRIMSK